MSKLITNAVRHTGASADALTLDASGNITVEGNLTVDGTSTLTGAVTSDSGSWVKLSQVLNGGNVSDITFTSLDTSTYRSFKFIGGMQPVTDDINLRMRFRVGSSDLTTSKYDWGYNLMHPDNAQGGHSLNDQDHFKLFGDSGNAGREQWHFELLVTPHVDGHAAQIGNSITWQGWRLDQDHNFRTSVGSGYYDVDDQYVNGFKLYAGSGNFAYHNYTLYGIKA